MTLNDEERGLLQSSVRGMLAQHWPSKQALGLQEQPQAAQTLWQRLSQQGLTALGTQTDEGGLIEILLVQEELGRAACPAALAGAALIHLMIAPAQRDSVVPRPCKDASSRCCAPPS